MQRDEAEALLTRAKTSYRHAPEAATGVQGRRDHADLLLVMAAARPRPERRARVRRTRPPCWTPHRQRLPSTAAAFTPDQAEAAARSHGRRGAVRLRHTGRDLLRGPDSEPPRFRHRDVGGGPPLPLAHPQLPNRLYKKPEKPYIGFLDLHHPTFGGTGDAQLQDGQATLGHDAVWTLDIAVHQAAGGDGSATVNAEIRLTPQGRYTFEQVLMP
ncbi:hypothetical protein ABZZ74_27115 [Streptomyces sp. NPDC006476]|uniref:hypothetical protein n=1 Tax=Streptomyces sp. NPDC006476 TaxID=3157175 RepID=UPI0033A70E0D